MGMGNRRRAAGRGERTGTGARPGLGSGTGARPGLGSGTEHGAEPAAGHRAEPVRRRRPGKRTWLAVAAVVVGAVGGGVLVANAGSGSGTGTALAGGPIRTSVRTLGIPGSSVLRTLPARSTKPFSMVNVSWRNGLAPLKGTVRIRTRSAATGAWTNWLTMDPSDELPDTAERDRPGVRGGMNPVWSGPSDGVQAKVAASGGRTLPAGLTVDLVDPGSTRSRTSTGEPAVGLAGYAMDGTDPTDSASPTDSATAGAPTDSDSPSATESTEPTDTPSAPDSATPTTPATDSGSPSTSDSATPSPSASSWPGQLPTLAEAYPSCPDDPSPSPVASDAPDPLPTPTTSTVAPPTVITRAGWGADECARDDGYPDYGTAVKVIFVHHTDTTNDYTCDQSPAIVRSVYAEHLHEGWRDIGYNFLVDKCGNIFEGRFGGMALPVVGAQTYGFNTNSMGIAAIGTYTDLTGGDSGSSDEKGAAPTKAMEGAIARIAAWKLGITGADALNGTATLPEGEPDSPPFVLDKTYSFHVISGHRDGFATDCPGDQLYSALPAIRSYAAGPVAGLSVTGVTGGPYGTQKSGTSYVTGTTATVHWTTSTPPAVISGFDVLVGGTVVAHAAGTATSATVTLPSGSHSIQVRAAHVTGKTTLSAAVTDIADTTHPVFSTAPAVVARTGTVSSTAVPVSVTWKATDNTGLHAQAVTAPTAATLSTTATSWSTTAKPATAKTYSIKATDLAGNTTTGSVSRTASIIQETSTTRTGTWSKRSSSSYLGGYSYSSSAKNASISWTFTGRSVSWIVSRATTSGQVYVYLDGKKISTVDLKSSKTLYRQAIWTHSWSTSAQHTLKIVVVGTSGRPTITTDGIAVIK
jgi:N-acetylmuramoyl-L-alanine amidase